MAGSRYVVASLGLLVALALGLTGSYRLTVAQGANRAGLVVQMKDGSVVTRCISFSEPQISGYDLLRRSGLPLIVDVTTGVEVCKIGSSGCNFPAQQCFCDCQNLAQSCVYWTYFYQADGAWKYSPLGASAQPVTNGTVNGWVYGSGSASSSNSAPPLLTFDQICSAAPNQITPTQPTPTVAVVLPTPTAQTIPNPTSTLTVNPVPATPVENATPGPTHTPMPTDTAVPTVVPVGPTPTYAATNVAVVEATGTPTPQPTASETATPAATPKESASATVTALPPTATPSATNTPTPAGEPGTGGLGGYLVFGAIAVALVVFLLISRRGTGIGAGSGMKKP